MKPIRRLYHRARRKARRALFRYAVPEVALAVRQLEQRVAREKSTSPFPGRNLVVAQQPPDSPVLVLAPHPDDEVIGPGGLLAQTLASGGEVAVLYLTDGRGPGAGSLDLAETRRREARKLAEAFPFQQIFWDIRDNHLTNSPETVRALAQEIDSLSPRTILVPSFFDHQFDHFSANALLADALENCTADITVCGYEVWDNLPFPNYVVDISDHFEAKAAMLRHYEVPNQITDFIQLCRCRSAVHYLLYVNSVRREPEGYAEAFYRLDAQTYRELFAEYLGILESANSPLISHITAKKHDEIKPHRKKTNSG